MNPADFLTNPQAWLHQSHLQPSQTPPLTSTSQQPAHYAQPQQERQANFSGLSIPTASTTTQYSQHALSAASPAPTSLNPYYNLSSGSTMSNGISNSGSTMSSSAFYPQSSYLGGYYYQPNASIPVSTYSSLSGATTMPPSAQQQPAPSMQNSVSQTQVQQSSQQPHLQISQQQQPSQQPQPQQPQPQPLQQSQQSQTHQLMQQSQPQQQPQQSQRLPQVQRLNTNEQQSQQLNGQQTSSQQTLAIDPSLMGLSQTNPYMSYYPYQQQSNGQQASGTMAQMYQMPNTMYQYMQVPQVVSPAQLMRSPNGYPNVQASRSTSTSVQLQHPGTSQTPPVMNGNQGSPSTGQHAAVSSSGGRASPSVPPSLGLIYKDILTPQNLDKQPETVAHALIKRLDQSDYFDIDLPTRLDILAKIRDNAGKDFYKVWAKSETGVDVLKDWLKTTTTLEGWDETVMPLLFVIDRLPLEISMLRSTKIGKVLVKVTKEPPSAAAKDLATNIETKWRALIPESEGGGRDDDEARNKKRKLEAPAPRTAPPKKQAVAPPKPTVVKKVTVQPTKDSKVDSSFFSSKPKPKLPSFRKLPNASSTTMKKEEPDSAVAQPSSIDPFQEAMKLMGKNTPPPIPPPMEHVSSTNGGYGTSVVAEVKVILGKNGKPKKKVKFPTDDKLVLIKYIERAIYEDDHNGEETHHSSYRDLDIDEGHALHAMMFEEQIDFYEPQLIDFPEDVLERIPRGTESTETAAQEEREKSALMAVYMSPAHIPDTPSDLMPGLDAMPDESQLVMMLPGAEVASLEAPAAPIITASLQDLLAKISGNNSQAAQQQQHFTSSSYNGQYASYAGHSQEEDISWGAGGSGDDMYGGMNGQHDGNAGNNGPHQGGWNGQGLPPPTGGQFSDEWDNTPPASRGWGGGGPKQRGQQQGRSNIPPGIRINAPCKFFSGPHGCRNGSSCAFIHG